MTDDIDGALDAARMLGRRLGRYTCVRQLGSGGMADVYLARHSAKGFSKVFALKRIKPKYAGDRDFTRMFMREANLSASLDHPNIAQVVDFGQDGREYYLVMEYVHGLDLRELLRFSRAGRLPLECAIAIITRLCAGLHYAHGKVSPEGVLLGLVHRDVSPNNVLLSVDGAVKLTDFGIAKGFGTGGTGTASSMLVGKPGYMSPEQVRCEPLDRRSDVFALGILLYETTTGHRCFFGDSVFATLNATQRAKFEAPSTHVPNYPQALARIVTRALRGDPEQRFDSARALQSALEEFALDQRIRASDTVLCDYLASLELPLGDPALRPQTYDATDTEIREANTVIAPPEDVHPPQVHPSQVHPVETPPAPRRARRGWWWVMGAVAAVVMGLGILGATSDEPTPAPHDDPVRQDSDVSADPLMGSAPDQEPRPTSPAAHSTGVPSTGAPSTGAPSTGVLSTDSNSDSEKRPPIRRSRPRRSSKRRPPPARTADEDLNVLAPPSRRRP